VTWRWELPEDLTAFFGHADGGLVVEIELGGILLLLGLLTRISAGALGIVMIVAVKSAQWADVDSLQTLLGLEEVMYLALFLWLAIAGAGRISVDHILERR